MKRMIALMLAVLMLASVMTFASCKKVYRDVDAIKAAGLDSIAVGKIYDIFAGKGVSYKTFTHSNKEGMDLSLDALDHDFEGLCFFKKQFFINKR